MKNKEKQKQAKRISRQRKTRKKIRATTTRPRLSVFRSHKHIYVQVIDDPKGMTLVSASDQEIKGKKSKKELARAVGELIAKKCLAKDIKVVVFDKGQYQYHGRIAILAAAARQGGLIF